MVNDRVQFVDCVLVLVSVVSGSVSRKVWIGSSVTPHAEYTRNPCVSPALFILTPPPSDGGVAKHRGRQGFDKTNNFTFNAYNDLCTSLVLNAV